MLLHIISSLSKIVSNSACFHAHAIKFGWTLVHVVVDMHTKFHRQILVWRRITVQQVGNMEYHDLPIISSLSKIVSNSA